MEQNPSSPIWYGRHGAELIGPLTTERLQQLVADHTLRDHDTVRLGTDGPWMPVGEIQKLFAEGDTPHDAAQAARDALARASRAHLIDSGSDEAPLVARLPRRSRLNAAGLLGDLLAATIGRALGWLFSQVMWLLKYRPVRWAAFLALVAGASGAIYWFVVLPRLPLSAEAVLAEYQQLWVEVAAARERKAGDDEWESLIGRADSLAFRHELPLRHQATSRQPIIQELLWATPNLPQAVRDSRGERSDESQAIAKVRIHLSNAERLAVREGEIAEQLPAADRSGARTMFGESGIDALFVGFLVFDGLVVLAVGWYVLRRATTGG